MNGYVCHVNENIEGAIYIGRANGRKGLKASPFANPFVIGKAAPPELERLHEYVSSPLTREMVIFLYSTELEAGDLFHLIPRIPELRDKPLACWCRRSDTPYNAGYDGGYNVCHGDILIDWLNHYTDDQLHSFIKENANVTR